MTPILAQATSFPIVPIVIAALIVPLLIGLTRAGIGIGADFVIRYRPGRGTTVRGRLPASKTGGIAEFFARDLRPDGSVTVRGSFIPPGRTLRLHISGPLSAGEKQRARNFLVNHLR